MRRFLSAISAPIAATAVIAGLMVTASPASAYKRTQTCDSYGTYKCDDDEEPKPIHWPVRCVKYRINEEGSRDFPAQNGEDISSELRGLVKDSFQTWNDVDCSDFKMVEGGLTSTSAAEYRQEAGFTGNTNIIVWRDDDWPYRSDSAFALTSVTFNSKSGRIADADIEINSSFYEYANLSNSEIGERNARVDLRNTLTHEVGHFVGLDHPEVEEATMYSRAPVGEVKKRTLHEDDRAGICAIYPTQFNPATCTSPEEFEPPPPQTSNPGNDNGCGKGCATTGGAPAPWLALLLFGFLRARRSRRDDARTQAD